MFDQFYFRLLNPKTFRPPFLPRYSPIIYFLRKIEIAFTPLSHPTRAFLHAALATNSSASLRMRRGQQATSRVAHFVLPPARAVTAREFGLRAARPSCRRSDSPVFIYCSVILPLCFVLYGARRDARFHLCSSSRVRPTPALLTHCVVS